MTNFLDFLNQANEESLKQLEGISEEQVAKLIQKRPFSSLDEISKMRGFGVKRMASLQEDYERFSVTEQETETKEAVEIKPDENTSLKAARRGFWRGLITWVIVLLLLAAAGFAAVKWGWPFIYNKYIKPVENNATDITNLASQQSVEVARLNDEINALQERVVALEIRADGVDETLAAHTASLDQLAAMQDTLSAQMADQKSALLDELANQITLTRAIELLSRTRLYLSESNFGLAKDDLQTCRNLLYPLLAKIPADQVQALTVVISRLDLALSNLPAYPVVAVFDVDTAWQYLVDGLPNVPEMAVTPLVLPAVETTPVEATEAPTPEATLEPTATP